MIKLPSLRMARGTAAETRALRYLEKAGLKLVERNWRCPRGEIDLVMREHDTLVLVEVRTRGRRDFGGAAASVDARKRQRIIYAARAYLAAHPKCADLAVRFDVVAFEEDQRLDWIRQAFDADD